MESMDWEPATSTSVQSYRIYPSPQIPGSWPLSPMGTYKRPIEYEYISVVKRVCRRMVSTAASTRISQLPQFPRIRMPRIQLSHLSRMPQIPRLQQRATRKMAAQPIPEISEVPILSPPTPAQTPCNPSQAGPTAKSEPCDTLCSPFPDLVTRHAAQFVSESSPQLQLQTTNSSRMSAGRSQAPASYLLRMQATRTPTSSCESLQLRSPQTSPSPSAKQLQCELSSCIPSDSDSSSVEENMFGSSNEKFLQAPKFTKSRVTPLTDLPKLPSNSDPTPPSCHRSRQESLDALEKERLEILEKTRLQLEVSRIDENSEAMNAEQVKALKKVSPQTPKSRSHTGLNNKRVTRGVLKQLEEAKSAKHYDIKPLSKEWELKVQEALQNGHGNYPAAALQKVVPPLGRGGMDSWLNDETINGYLTLVVKHGNRNDRPEQVPSFHAFSSYFYTNLATRGYESVRRWAGRAKIGNTKLLDVEKIFIPVNPNNSHWTLLVVEPRNKHITHYNSLGSSKSSVTYVNHIKNYLANEVGKTFVEDDWVVEYAGKSSQQQNGSDCGVFTITTAKQLMLGFASDSYMPAEIPLQRRRIVAELINGELIKNDTEDSGQ